MRKIFDEFLFKPWLYNSSSNQQSWSDSALDVFSPNLWDTPNHFSNFGNHLSYLNKDFSFDFNEKQSASLATNYDLTPNTATYLEADGYFLMTVSRSGDLPAETLYYSTLIGTASAGAGDYDGHVNSALSFGSGESSRTFRIYLNEDTEVEGDEYFRVMITANSGNSSSQALDISTITIRDDDNNPITNYSLTPTTATYEENDGYFLMTVTRSGDLPAETLYYSTLVGTASASAGDYDGEVNTALSFGSGESSRTFRIYLNEDTEVEGNETFRVMITANSGDSSSQALDISTITIRDDDTNPVTNYSLTPSTATYEETDGYFLMTVTRSGDLPAETLYYSTLFGTASSSSGDYDGEVNTALSFGSGESSRTFRIYLNDDAEVEGNETFRVMITANSGDSSSQALDISNITIRDNDTNPVTNYDLTPNSQTYEENDGYFLMTVTRTGDLPAETLYYSTLFGTASSSSGDYDGEVNTALTFGFGETSRTFRIYLNEDTEVEGNETFRVMITANSGDSSSQALDISNITIRDDDTAQNTTYNLTPDVQPVSESVGTITFTVTRSGDTPAETLYYSTLFGTASQANGDYQGHTNSALTFGAGQTTATFQVTINDGIDRLDMSNAGITDISQLTISQVGADTLVEYGADSILLQGVDMATVNQFDFVFAPLADEDVWDFA